MKAFLALVLSIKLSAALSLSKQCRRNLTLVPQVSIRFAI